MVLRQVRKNRHVVVNPGHSLPVERVRADFHRHTFATGAQHLAHQILNLHRFWCRPRRRNNPTADLVLHRAKHPSTQPSRFHNRLHHERRRRLAIRTGHADDFELLRRMIVKTRRRQRQRLPRIVHPDLSRSRIQTSIMLEHDCRRAPVNCHLDIPMTIGFLSRHCEKQITGLHAPGVIRNPGNVPVKRTFDSERMNGLENLGEFHQSFATFFSSTSGNCGGIERYCVTFSATPRNTGPATEPP